MKGEVAAHSRRKHSFDREFTVHFQLHVCFFEPLQEVYPQSSACISAGSEAAPDLLRHTCVSTATLISNRSRGSNGHSTDDQH